MSENNNNKNGQAEVLEKISTASTVVGSLTFGTIFGMLAFQSLTTFAGYILFPINAAVTLFDMILAWRAAHISGWKSGPLLRAGIETVAGAAFLAGIIGSLVATALFASITTPIFVAALGLKSLYHTGSAFYYWGKSAATRVVDEKTADQKVGYQMKAIDHTAGALASLVSAVAMVGVFMLGKATFGIAAVAVAGFGVATALTKAFHRHFAKSAEKDTQSVEEATPHQEEIQSKVPGSTADIRNGLDHAKSVEFAKETDQKPKQKSVASSPAGAITRNPSNMFNPAKNQQPANDNGKAPVTPKTKKSGFCSIM